MAYVAWSVVFGEQPTAAKWNILGTNDASFNDGTGIGDDTIDSRHYITNSIDGEHLSTSTILLGYTAKTSDFSTASTSTVQITGLSVTVTIPAGGRSVKVTVYGQALYTGSGSGARADLSIWDGTVGSGTRIANSFGMAAQTYGTGSAFACAIVTPAAGSKTYNAGLSTTANTATFGAGATAPGFILVELI